MKDIDSKIPNSVAQVADQLSAAGYQVYLVGGCVRDIVLGKQPKDWDLATNATPEEMLHVFERAHYDNSFGTVRVIKDTNDITKTVEVTTFRTEDIYSDNRRPDNIAYADTIEEDLKRRDFTINALAIDLEKVSRDKLALVSQETIIDNHGGLSDLQQKILRTVGNPEQRLAEDPLRIMRGVRFAAELSFKIEHKTRQVMATEANRLNDIAVERIREEFEKIVICENPKLGLELLKSLNVLSIFLPELTATENVEQNQAHEFDLWTHLVNSMQAAADKNWPKHIRLAALLHDIGKVETKEWDEEREDWSFHNHEVVGARMSRDILERLKFPKNLVDQVVNLVRWHMFFSDTDQITHSAVRRLIRNAGKENIWDLMKLRRADRLGMGRPKEEPYRLRKYQSMVEEVIRDPVSVSKLAIDGNDVIHETDEQPGPRIGYILHALLDTVLENPKKNTKEELIQIAKQLSQLETEELEKRGEKGKKEKKRLENQAIKDIKEKYHVD